jgi:CSLREA domain-containing protein
MHRTALLATLAWLWLGAAPASAAEIVTTHLGDAPDFDLGDGICDTDPDTPDVDHDDDPSTPALGQCSLRAAVQTANEEPGPDLIRLRPARYVLTLAGPGEDDAATGDLDITSEITIDGGGFRLTLIDGRRLKDRIFDVRPGGGDLTLTQVSLLSAKAPRPELDSGAAPGHGGCLRAEAPADVSEAFLFRCAAPVSGGCIATTDDLAVTDSIFSGCRAKEEGGGLAVAAGASATLARVTGGVCKAAAGGAVATRGALSLTNTTLTLNRAPLGGAVAALGAGNAAIARSTLFANSRDNLGVEAGAAATVTSSIVSDAKTDCVGSVSSGGGNLESATSCGFAGAGDQQNQDPLLLALTFEGSVPTAGLQEDSPAIDNGVDVADACLDPGDARMRLRTTSADPEPPTLTDAGAYEFGAVALAQPGFSSAPPSTATVGVPYSYDAQAADPKGACTLTFSLEEAPDGMTIAPASGVVSWTPTDEGEEIVTIRVSDEAGLFRRQTFSITVAAAP